MRNHLHLIASHDRVILWYPRNCSGSLSKIISNHEHEPLARHPPVGSAPAREVLAFSKGHPISVAHNLASTRRGGAKMEGSTGRFYVTFICSRNWIVTLNPADFERQTMHDRLMVGLFISLLSVWNECQKQCLKKSHKHHTHI